MRPLLLLALLSACAAPPGCPPGMSSTVVAEAYFGLNRRDRPSVTPEEWGSFLDTTVTPAFPDGLTVLDGDGQWRNATGHIARERSKVLVVAMPGLEAAAALARLDPVIAQYRSQFGQESVLAVTTSACLRF